MSEFICERCGRSFEKAWSDEDAAVEFAKNFPGFALDDCALVCDDCYEALMLRQSECHER